MTELLSFQAKKPYRVLTNDGDYFFYSKKKARYFAKMRHGFLVETTIDQQLKGGDNIFKDENNSTEFY